MGTQKRQRRAAKQRTRAQAAGFRHQVPPRPGPGPRALDEVTAVVYLALDALRAGDAPGFLHLVSLLDEGPPVPGGAELARRVLADLERGRLVELEAHGWAPGDVEAYVSLRGKIPAGAGDVERRLRRLGLLDLAVPLPPVSASSGVPAAAAAKLATIRGLLAKAESTTFPEEAEALSAKAQELMARYRVDAALVEGGSDATPIGRRIWHDDPYVEAKARLLASVARANRCRSVLLSGLGCSHVAGFAGDLDMTELLHTSLLVQATRAMAAAGSHTDRAGRSRTRSFRQSFLVAYAWRIGERLTEAASAAESELDDDAGGTLLPVLARRDGEVEAALHRAFPAAAPMRVAISNHAGWAAGAAAAELADLRAGPELDR